MEEKIAQLRQHIKDKDYGLGFYFNDKFLANFINGRKGDLGSAKKYLDAYIQMRFESYPEFIHDSIPVETRLLEEGHIRVLKALDPQGCFILHASAAQWKPNPDAKLAVEEWLRMLCLCMDYFMYNEDSLCKDGVVAIFDARGWEYKHMRVLTLPNLIKANNVGLRYPLRFKGIHIITDSFIVKSVVNLVSPFLPHKLASRIQIHKTIESLSEHMLRETLPVVLGGFLEDSDAYDMRFCDKLKGMEPQFARVIEVLKKDEKILSSQ